MQVLVYSYIYESIFSTKNLTKPALAYVNSAKSNDDICVKAKGNEPILLDDPQKYDKIEEGVKDVIRKMLDMSEPFKANKKEAICKYCDFKSYCGVKEEKK